MKQREAEKVGERGWQQGASYLSHGADGAASQQRLRVTLRFLAASDHKGPQSDRLWCQWWWWCSSWVRLGFGPDRRQAESQAADGEEKGASHGSTSTAAPTARRTENHRQGKLNTDARTKMSRGGKKKKYIYICKSCSPKQILVAGVQRSRESLVKQRRENGSCARTRWQRRSEFKPNALVAEEGCKTGKRVRASSAVEVE